MEMLLPYSTGLIGVRVPCTPYFRTSVCRTPYRRTFYVITPPHRLGDFRLPSKKLLQSTLR